MVAIDDRYLIIGTSNWTYRSLEYDGEMTAFIDDGPTTTAAVHAVLAHYNTLAGAPAAITALNMEAVAPENVDAIRDPNLPRQYGTDRQMRTLLLPLEHRQLPDTIMDWRMDPVSPRARRATRVPQLHMVLSAR